MDKKSQKLLESLKNKKVGVFADDSNLYHSYKKYGWRIDFVKLKKLLGNYCNLQFINYYIAIPDAADADHKGVQNFLKHISLSATIKKKKLKYIP